MGHEIIFPEEFGWSTLHEVFELFYEVHLVKISFIQGSREIMFLLIHQ